jgi:hypothetical protein
MILQGVRVLTSRQHVSPPRENSFRSLLSNQSARFPVRVRVLVCSYEASGDLSEHFSSVVKNTQVIYNCTQHSGQVFFIFYKIQSIVEKFFFVIKHAPQPIRSRVIIMSVIL